MTDDIPAIPAGASRRTPTNVDEFRYEDRTARDAAFRNWSVETEVAEIVETLRGVQRGLLRWNWGAGRVQGDEWTVNNEAQFQRLLWLVLGSRYPDLRAEEPIASSGGRTSYPDFALPQLGVAIEAKFVRSAREFSKVIEEVAADVGLYLSRATGYRHLVVAVWDQAQMPERHDQLIRGLRDVGATDAIVIQRPGVRGEESR